MNEREELLACPFCGGKPFLHGPDNPGHEYWISCQSCQASSTMRSNFEATKAAWNARTGSPAQPPEQPLGFETVTIPKAAIDWLNGEGPDGDGNWFGDSEPEIKPGKPIKRYWWRSKFRSLAFPSANCGGSDV